MYPTYMHETKGFSQPMASKATMIAKTGAIVGGTVRPTPLPSPFNKKKKTKN